MHSDINDLQKKIVTKDDLQEMETNLEAKMDNLKEEIMEVLKNFVIEKTLERCPNLGHVRSQDLLLLGPKNSKVLLFPYREIRSPQFSRAIPLP
jgi:hypothetical protein